jgi:dTDP-4-dehydrorhamnose reductase
VGHDPEFRNGLIGWFLNQRYSCQGYPEAIFSGFPVPVLAQIIRDFVIPYPDLSGVYHLASKAISKFDLLTLVAEIYDSPVVLLPDPSVKLNRSLNATKFQIETSYSPPPWRTLVGLMHDDYLRFHK